MLRLPSKIFIFTCFVDWMIMVSSSFPTHTHTQSLSCLFIRGKLLLWWNSSLAYKWFFMTCIVNYRIWTLFFLPFPMHSLLVFSLPKSEKNSCMECFPCWWSCFTMPILGSLLLNQLAWSANNLLLAKPQLMQLVHLISVRALPAFWS